MPVRALNLYYARDDSTREQVLATRLRATDVREAIGIPRGRVFTRVDGDGDLPDVMWDCPFADARAHDVDMQARAASTGFEACRATMRTLTRRFERVIYAALDVIEKPEPDRAQPMMQIWMVGDESPDIPSLRSSGATAVLRRADDNASLPDWIVEIPARQGSDASGAIESWIARHPKLRSTLICWERTG